MIYFVEHGPGGPIKIGSSLYPEHRLASLQSGTPVRLRLLATMPGDSELEKALHDRFDAHRVNKTVAKRGRRTRGEWFWPAPELAIFIGSLMMAASEAA